MASQLTNRTSTKRLDIYNEGLRVFLFDPASAEEILRLLPAGKDYPLDEKNLAAAAERNLILLYELQQDDELAVEACTGRELSKRERSNLPWLAAQYGWLDVPSGVLRVDSANTLLLSSDGAECDSGAEIEIAPGIYKVTLQRIDFSAMDDEQFDDYDGPSEVITLAKCTRGSVRPNPGLLEFNGSSIPAEPVDASSPENHEVPVGRMKSGEFHGHVLFLEDGEFLLNLSQKQAKQMGLQDNDKIDIRVQELDISIAGCIQGHDYFELSAQELKQVGPYVATAIWNHAPAASTTSLVPVFAFDRRGRKKLPVQSWVSAIVAKRTDQP